MSPTTDNDLESWDNFCEWYDISGTIYTDRLTGWYVWQTIIAFQEKKKRDEDSKDKEEKDQ